jgi:hypothetical protein
MALTGMDFGTTDPKKIAQQNRQWGLSTGQGLMDEAGARAIGSGQKADATSAQLQGLLDPSGTMSRLDSWMTPLANGQGGYNADELSQIRMTPQQQQDMVTQAGVTAGLRNSAAVGAAQRASAAAGGNPQALATYRARAAMQGAADAGDAMTGARVAASNAAAGRAQTAGNARLGQQQQGLNYYQGLQGQGSNYLAGLQQQQTGQQENAFNRQAQTYGTATGAANQAGGLAQQASQNPTTFDKIMGGVAGAVGGAGGLLSKLEDGGVMPAQKRPAVVGEGGPERVVSTSRPHMETGGVMPSLYRARPPLDLGTTTPQADGSMMFTPGADNPGRPPSLFDNVPAPASSALDQGTTSMNPDGSMKFTPGADSISLGTPAKTGFLNRLKGAFQSPNPTSGPPVQQSAAPAASSAPSAMNTAKTLGQLGGALFSKLEDGAVMPAQGANGIFTKATMVNLLPGEAVVPLNYRPGARVRPNVATSYPAAPVTYRSQRGGANGQSSARP